MAHQETAILPLDFLIFWKAPPGWRWWWKPFYIIYYEGRENDVVKPNETRLFNHTLVQFSGVVGNERQNSENSEEKITKNPARSFFCTICLSPCDAYTDNQTGEPNAAANARQKRVNLDYDTKAQTGAAMRVTASKQGSTPSGVSKNAGGRPRLASVAFDGRYMGLALW
jgi:hypothetical protein